MIPVLSSRAWWIAAATNPDGSVDFWDRLSGWTVLLALGVVAVAVVLSLALGPLGRPQTRSSRSGGLTRALSRTQSGSSGHPAPLDAQEGPRP